LIINYSLDASAVCRPLTEHIGRKMIAMWK